jgi:transketolase
VVEEHVAQGGAGQALAAWLLQAGLAPGRFQHFSALGYPSGNYGSQQFHRAESGLDPGSVLRALGVTPA